MVAFSIVASISWSIIWFRSCPLSPKQLESKSFASSMWSWRRAQTPHLSTAGTIWWISYWALKTDSPHKIMSSPTSKMSFLIKVGLWKSRIPKAAIWWSAHIHARADIQSFLNEVFTGCQSPSIPGPVFWNTFDIWYTYTFPPWAFGMQLKSYSKHAQEYVSFYPGCV